MRRGEHGLGTRAGKAIRPQIRVSSPHRSPSEARRPAIYYPDMTAEPGGPHEIRLRFSGVTRPHGVFVGPAPWFRIIGTSILQGPHGDLVAESRQHQWKVRELIFNRLDCRQP